MSSKPEPLLSVVATSRNDDHGHNLLRRTQIFVSGFINQCKQHGLAAELILVDWNPPADRPKLAEVLSWPADPSPCQVRLIEVPPEIHGRLRHSAALPLFQMIAKNVGIRRSRGRFVLATNIDILFSDELIHHITAGKLQPGRMYRMDRHDVMPDVPLEASVQEQLAYCRTHLVRVNTQDGSFDVTPDGRRTLAQVDIAVPDDGITPCLGWYPPGPDEEGNPCRWARRGAELLLEPRPGPSGVLCIEMEPGPGVGRQPFELQVVDNDGHVVAEGIVGRNRHLVYVTLPTSSKTSCEYRLQVGQCAPAAVGESPNLDFRVFRLGWADWAGDLSPEAETPRRNLRTIGMCVDVVPPGADLALGRGWYETELVNGEAFRWVSDNAELIIRETDAHSQHVLLELEPGPGTRGRPFELRLCDVSGHVVDRAIVTRRQRLLLSAPHRPGQACAYQLRMDSHGFRTRGDPRPLNYRVFCATLFESATDGMPPRDSNAIARERTPFFGDDGLAFGSGWLESDGAQTPPARRGTHNAEIFIQGRDRAGRLLRLDLEKEPPAEGQPVELVVRNDKGDVVLRTQLAGRQTLMLPVLPKQIARFRFCVVEDDACQDDQDSTDFEMQKYGAGPRTQANESRARFRLLSWDWQETAVTPEPASQSDPRQGLDEDRLAALSDIYSRDAGIQFGKGWTPPDCSKAPVYRLAESCAEIIARPPEDSSQALRLDVEPVRARASAPLVLHVCDHAGRRLADFTLDRRQYIEIPAPTGFFCGTVVFRFFVESDCLSPSTSLEKHKLQVFGCAWSSRASMTDSRELGTLAKVSDMSSPGKRDVTSPQQLHTNACGDFTLLTREDWLDLRGYPELEIFSFHLDSVLCFSAFHAGIPEEVLKEPMRIYHIEHGAGSGWTPEGQVKLWKSVIAKGIPFLENDDLWSWTIAMRRFHVPLIFNRKDWGLIRERLPETVIGESSPHAHQATPISR